MIRLGMITAKSGKDPGRHYQELTAKHGEPSYTRIDAPATPALPLLDRPSIAVMPFRSYAAGDEPFIDGLTDELINALSRWRSFPIIARDSVFIHRGRDKDVRAICLC